MFAKATMGAGGVILPPDGYTGINLFAKYDIPLIDDEVICGFGRLVMSGGWAHSDAMF